GVKQHSRVIIVVQFSGPAFMDAATLQQMGRKVIEIERDALDALLPRINGDFARACEIMLACKGRIVVTGMGKSGHIGGKIAATLASTGAPSFFVHPGEASHGDLGMITKADVVLAISNSGETAEVLTILPLIKRMGAPLVAMTGRPASTLAKTADVHLDVTVAQEACPLNLAPTASTTATLAMGDALAVALLEARGFTPEDFAMSHPGGSLGRRLLLKIGDLMHKGERLPRVAPDASLSTALLEMTRKGLGITAITHADGTLLGVYTDGDLRRTLEQGVDVRTARIADVMTAGGKTAKADWLAAQAVQLMEKHKITVLLVVDEAGKLVGAIHMQDLLRAGVV
ncbi:MAG TPA: KpsF/GutQ family sugar-phosphate isomerase, partial [Stenotrophobium sp.]|nr:KpsF/GutQ family sugar-phosphate isomerase [Stenotrophobium sp.]